MSFSKNDLELIKSKIILSEEIEKKTKVVKKGKDSWCCCPFHDEKTPSCKINDDLGSYYCFGCGAKGDIFTIYTELYNFSFPEAVKELAQKVGIRIEDNFDSNINKIECTKEYLTKNMSDLASRATIINFINDEISKGSLVTQVSSKDKRVKIIQPASELIDEFTMWLDMIDKAA